MNSSLKLTLGAVLWAAMFLQPATLLAQSTAFTYQGRLDSSGSPYTGPAEFQPTLWDAASGGSLVAANSPAQVVVGVTNGLFVLPLDFGANFPGADRWLQLEVRTAVGPFTLLSPRQKLTPTPYAITAGNLSGTLSAAQLTGTLPGALLAGTYPGAVTLSNPANSFTGNGAGLTGLNAGALASGTVPDARLGTSVARTQQVWLVGGNSGTTPGTHFLGTSDNQPVEFKVNGQRALRLEPHTTSPNVLGGSPANIITNDSYGAVIAGGGSSDNPNRVGASFATVSGGYGNTASSWNATVSGGQFNTASGNWATVSGGQFNTASGHRATVSGGQVNAISTGADYSAIGGGSNNTIASNAESATIAGGTSNNIGTNADHSAIGGGSNNTIASNGWYATIPGGWGNFATNYAFAAGLRAKANHTGAFVWADSTDADFASTRLNQFNLRATGGVRVDTGSGPGISLNAADTPLITRGWDAFGPTAPDAKQGHGRWGLFMEPHTLALGMPALSGKTVRVVKYYPDGSYTVLMTVAQDGAVTATSFTPTSDRNAKQGFEPVNAAEVLEKVARLPLTRWQFKEDDSGAWHLGPTAQDFHAAFGLGANDTTIATVDADGVALAAIQGLNEKVEVRSQKSEVRIQKLEAENAALRAELEQLKQLVGALAAQLDGGAQ